MAKKVTAKVKLQLPAGKATTAPPVGPALAPHGINMMEFIKSYNAQTAPQAGSTVPVEVTIFEDRYLHLHPENPAGFRIAHQSGRAAERRLRPG